MPVPTFVVEGERRKEERREGRKRRLFASVEGYIEPSIQRVEYRETS